MPPVKKPPKKEIAQIITQITATVHKMFAMLKKFKGEKIPFGLFIHIDYLVYKKSAKK